MSLPELLLFTLAFYFEPNRVRQSIRRYSCPSLSPLSRLQAQLPKSLPSHTLRTLPG